MTLHGRKRRAWRLLVIAPAVVAIAGCAQTLPQQDRRIYTAVPVAKLSADILWNEYSTDPVEADRRYWGKVLEVSGEVSARSPAGTEPFVMFAQSEDLGLVAWLLGDEAMAIMEEAELGRRMTLRCFCEGRGEDGNVRLKSCIQP